MSEELEKMSQEELTEAIKNAFKDNEEGLKHVDSIMNSIVELQKLDKEKPGSAMFRIWIMFLLMLFGGTGFGFLDTELMKEKEDESNNKDGESDSMEESTQCS